MRSLVSLASGRRSSQALSLAEANDDPAKLQQGRPSGSTCGSSRSSRGSMNVEGQHESNGHFGLVQENVESYVLSGFIKGKSDGGV